MGCATRDQPLADDPADAANLSEATSGGLARSGPHCVDDKVCGECHSEISESYRAVAMSKSLYPFDPKTAIENFSRGRAHYYHKPSNMHFEMAVRDGRMVVTRYRQRGDGTRIAQRKQSVDYVIGSGNHVRGYLYGNRTGELFEMPIVWYTQLRNWGMAPGYDLAEHEDFDRPITRQCMACHNAYPDHKPGDDLVGQRDLFPVNLPHGIGCQRCHGPGSEHVKLAALETSTLADAQNSIVNPGRLSPTQRDDVCLQCHLQPMSRRTSIVRKSGRGNYAFQPGDTLSDHVAYFELDEANGAANHFEINHHPYRLFQSQCFLQSDGQLNCMTCHDPHVKVAADQQAQHYRQRCLTCHELDDCLDIEKRTAPNADCVACHMPARRTQDVVHVVMTDHRIGRYGQPTDLVAEMPEREIASDLPIRDYSLRNPGANKDAQMLDMIARLRDRDYTAIADLARINKSLDSIFNEMLLELSLAQLQTKDLPAAEVTLRSLVDRQFAVSLVATNLGSLLVANRKYEEAIRFLELALECQPDSPETHYNLAVAFVKSNRTVEAINHYRRAIALRPTYSNARFNLGNALARAEQFEEAAAEYQQVISLKPNFAPAYKNLSSICRRQQAWPAALQALNDGHQAAPHDKPILLDLFLLLTGVDAPGLRDWSAALDVAMQIRLEAPQDKNANLMLAFAQAMVQQPDEATVSVEQAIRRGVSSRECALVLAIAQKQLGETQAAESNFRQGISGPRPSKAQRLLRAIRAAAKAEFDQ